VFERVLDESLCGLVNKSVLFFVSLFFDPCFFRASGSLYLLKVCVVCKKKQKKLQVVVIKALMTDLGLT